MQKTYDVYVGATLKLYSSAASEQHLRTMADVNHRESPIAKLAARVADFLWPNCQEMIDEAVKQSKLVKRARREEEVYEPPAVPHFLPITSW